MMRLVFDIEANGFFAEATKVWCVCAKDIDNMSDVSFGPDELDVAIQYLSMADELIGHNITCYDIPLLAKLLGFSYNNVITDTLIMSRLSNADRRKPTQDWNIRTMGGPHSLGAWGYRVGRGKPHHEEWDKYSPEMLHRCKEDVEINYLTYLRLLEEMKL